MPTRAGRAEKSKSSLPANHFAVMVFCTIVIDPPPRPKINRPTNMTMNCDFGEMLVSNGPRPYSVCPSKQNEAKMKLHAAAG